ncbi:MAG TPA: hypothetical protein VEJ18_00925 [Planctomycetota bacterium]|nr:hypothetical protein [Planctomycetota bacterium]
MQALRCGNGHIIDVQFLSDSLSACPTCGDNGEVRNCITGAVAEWPKARAERKAALKAAQEAASKPVEVTTAVETPPVETVTATPVVGAETVASPTPITSARRSRR